MKKSTNVAAQATGLSVGTVFPLVMFIYSFCFFFQIPSDVFVLTGICLPFHNVENDRILTFHLSLLPIQSFHYQLMINRNTVVYTY